MDTVKIVKGIESAKTKVKSLATPITAGATALAMSSQNVLAADAVKTDKLNTGITALDKLFGNLITMFSGIVVGIGILALILGILGLGQAQLQHDDSQKVAAIPKLVGGVIMIAVVVIVNMFLG